MHVTAAARVHEALNQAVQAIELHKKVLTTEASNVESLACLAAFQVSERDREGQEGAGSTVQKRPSKVQKRPSISTKET